jgi:hypothetical protein
VAGLGIFVAFAGYSVAYYGLTQIQGWNYGFLDLVAPGRWAKASTIPNDDPNRTLGPAAKSSSSKSKDVPLTPQQKAQLPTSPTSPVSP